MDDWRHISECLDSGLMGALKIDSCSASVGTGKADAAQLSDMVEASGADCRENAGVAACLSPGLTPYGASAPESAPARRQAGEVLRLELVVIRGGLAAFPMQPPRNGVPRARAAGPRLITIDGERVHQPASAWS